MKKTRQIIIGNLRCQQMPEKNRENNGRGCKDGVPDFN